MAPNSLSTVINSSANGLSNIKGTVLSAGNNFFQYLYLYPYEITVQKSLYVLRYPNAVHSHNDFFLIC